MATLGQYLQKRFSDFISEYLQNENPDFVTLYPHFQTSYEIENELVTKVRDTLYY